MSKYTGTSTLESMSQAGFYNQWTFDKFKKFLKGDILEVGCGIGNFTPTLSKYGKVFAIDIDQNLLEKFKDNNSNIKAGFGDIEKNKYFFGDKAFDTIVCINVLEHIQNDIRALENMFKLLKNEGNLILLVPIHSFLYGEIDKSIGHFRRYDPEDLVKRMENFRYSIVSYKKLNFVGAVGWFIAGKIFKNKQITENKVKLFNFISPILYLEDFIEPIIGTSVLIIARKE